MATARAARALLALRVRPGAAVPGERAASGDPVVVEVVGGVHGQLHPCLDRTLLTERPPA